jgi:hypothetical protein
VFPHIFLLFSVPQVRFLFSFLQEDARIAEENASQHSEEGDDERVNDHFVCPPTPQCPPPFSYDHVGDAVFGKSPSVAEVYFFVHFWIFIFICGLIFLLVYMNFDI